MKGFCLNEQGDVTVQNNDIKLVEGGELLAQKIQQVLRTNRGEWKWNPKEGIPVRSILKKNPNHAMIKDCIRSAIRQVDPNLTMKSCQIHTEGRKLAVRVEIEGNAKTEHITWEV